MKTAASSALLLLAGVGGSMACAAPQINPTALQTIKVLEGYVAKLYDDGYGTQHVGYGHACKQKNCAEVPYPIPISEPDAEKLLLADLKGSEGCVSSHINNDITLNANQYGALVSFTFNVGCTNLATSTLLKRLNNGETPSTVVKEELPKWQLAGGKVAPGLVERRKKEIALFNTPSSDKALPACAGEPTTPSKPTSKPTSAALPTQQASKTVVDQSSAPTDEETSVPAGASSPAGMATSNAPIPSGNAPVPSDKSTFDSVVVPTASGASQPSGATNTGGSGSTGTNVVVGPTCTAASCVVVTAGSSKSHAGALAAVAAVVAAFI